MGVSFQSATKGQQELRLLVLLFFNMIKSTLAFLVILTFVGWTFGLKLDQEQNDASLKDFQSGFRLGRAAETNKNKHQRIKKNKRKLKNVQQGRKSRKNGKNKTRVSRTQDRLSKPKINE